MNYDAMAAAMILPLFDVLHHLHKARVLFVRSTAMRVRVIFVGSLISLSSSFLRHWIPILIWKVKLSRHFNETEILCGSNAVCQKSKVGDQVAYLFVST